jgi:hypothetical protein
MIAVLFAGIVALTSPAPQCKGPDISVTDLRIKVIKGSTKTSTQDRVLITADLTNIGDEAQRPSVPQHAELLRGGAVVTTQPLPSLAAGVTYPLQFRLFRSIASRSDPLEVMVRYVLDEKRPDASMNCTAANDSMQKTF